MNLRPISNDKTPVEFQMQKLYLKKLPENREPESLEQELKEYFSSYGNIIDLKTLKNRSVIREERTLCVRHFQRRRNPA